MVSYAIVDTGCSASFPEVDSFINAQTTRDAEAVIVIGERVQSALMDLDVLAYRAVIVELNDECLGVYAPGDFRSQNLNVVGFSRFRLGVLPPTKLIELVVQPHTAEDAFDVAVSIFHESGFSAVRCSDAAGRIVDRLVRPYLNRALRAIDCGLAEAAELDNALRMGLGYKRGPIEMLHESGLEHHFDKSSYLHQALGEPAYFPERLAQVAAKRRSRARGDGT